MRSIYSEQRKLYAKRKDTFTLSHLNTFVVAVSDQDATIAPGRKANLSWLFELAWPVTEPPKLRQEGALSQAVHTDDVCTSICHHRHSTIRTNREAGVKITVSNAQRADVSPFNALEGLRAGRQTCG